MPAWLHEAMSLALTLSHGQQLGLAFLLGSFAVATWSDLKYLAAQREFLEVWVFVILAAVGHDVWRASHGQVEWGVLAVRWSLITALSLASFQEVGLLFRLAAGDCFALAAAASLLPAVHILLLYAAAKGASLVLGPVLRRGRPFYPFMPVVSVATLAVLGLGLLF